LKDIPKKSNVANHKALQILESIKGVGFSQEILPRVKIVLVMNLPYSLGRVVHQRSLQEPNKLTPKDDERTNPKHHQRASV
jgi:hypothetical protein